MKIDHLQATLLQTARHDAPSERVPYAFEKRIMARLAAGPRHDVLTEWTAAFWRAALSSLAVAFVVSLVNFATPTPASAGGDAVEIAAVDLENLAAQPGDAPTESW